MYLEKKIMDGEACTIHYCGVLCSEQNILMLSSLGSSPSTFHEHFYYAYNIGGKYSKNVCLLKCALSGEGLELRLDVVIIKGAI